MAMAQPRLSTALPTNLADFANDPRLYLSKETNTWRLEDDDGNEMEWDPTKGVSGAWVPVLDDEVVRAQQAAYSIAGVDEEEPAAPVQQREAKKTRKRREEDNLETNGAITIKRARGNDGKPSKPSTSKNTAVYVTGLPRDAEREEIISRFAKCGVIMEDDDGDPKVKMYADDQGKFNGEALVVYFKEDSVVLAENLLDEAELRIGEPSSRMRVRKAEFGHKEKGEGGGEVQKRVVDKKKATRRIVKLQKKLEEWDSEDEFGPSKEDDQAARLQPSRVVVLKHMFTFKELEEDPSLLLDLKEDVREECENLGVVTNVVLYDLEEEGIMTVKFKDQLSATACLLKMNGRFFSGRKVEASYLQGKPKYKRSGKTDGQDDDDEAEKKRLDQFTKWLENGGEGTAPSND